MEFIKGKQEGIALIKPRVFKDDRGWFTETYKSTLFEENGLPTNYLQDNMSSSTKGIVRGLHLQKSPHAQGKLLRCVKGALFDVAVDLREGSPTYGQWEGYELSEDNNHALYVPPGFGHGFQALADDTRLAYKCTHLYSKADEAGVRYDDPEIAIKWPIEAFAISPKDVELPFLKDFKPLRKEEYC